MFYIRIVVLVSIVISCLPVQAHHCVAAAQVELFISRTARIDKQDRKGFTALDWGIINGHTEVARVIIRHPSWRTALRPHISEAQAKAQQDMTQVGFTPFKRLIVSMPEVALLVLNRLMTVGMFVCLDVWMFAHLLEWDRDCMCQDEHLVDKHDKL
jgi:hypothetical protein